MLNGREGRVLNRAAWYRERWGDQGMIQWKRWTDDVARLILVRRPCSGKDMVSRDVTIQSYQCKYFSHYYLNEITRYNIYANGSCIMLVCMMICIIPLSG